MLSAFIQSILSYSAVPLVRQLIHHWYVHPGPLVLRTALFKYLTPAIDKDRTVSRRSEPSSRTALMGEQPNPWDLLQPQDVTSRHRGAKPFRRYELLGMISLLSPGYLLSVERCRARAPAPDHYLRLSSLLGPSSSQSSPACAITLDTRLPTGLSGPLSASVTLWEATAPVELPARHCP